jgi:hypothetical protein
MPTAVEIKKALKEAGLEIYRTRGDVVYLADRVRENLLMDAGTFVRVGRAGGDPQTPDPAGGSAPLAVGFVVRAQRSDFPNEGEEHLFERARRAAEPALGHGYREILAEVRKVKDPGDGERTLDTWCEVSFEKDVGDLAAAVVEARFALSLEKAASPTRGG